MWHIPTPKKVKVFLLTTLHKPLPMRPMFCHRGMIKTNLHPRRIHYLIDCEFTIHFWKSIGFLDLLFFQGDNIYDWIRHDIDDGSIFFVVC